MVAGVPGRFAIAVFSPPLDLSGNSVRAVEVTRTLSERWGLHLLDPAREVGRDSS